MSSEMSTGKRRYELAKRADAMEETRRRIAKAAAELHGTVGPAQTTISAVAQRAGVQRHTVYRHFATEADLFAACSEHFFGRHPWPDPAEWRAIEEPEERLATALAELYAYYERTERMFSNVLRDAELVPSIPPALAPFEDFLDNAAGVLAAGWTTRGRRRRVLRAATRHAVDFTTWRSLARDGDIGRARAVELVAALVARAAQA
jgi:AcrR family transcriptional regulator